MTFLRSLVLAFSSFSSIPMPQIEWREGNMKYLMCCFPFVGIAVALALAVWVWLAQLFGFGPVLFGAGIALVPVAVTGGIHLDGFCDVIDAQSSHADKQRKCEIMKDPHSGAFAAIGVAAYLVAYVAFASELPSDWRIIVVLGGIHVASRCLSSFATLVFPGNGSKGMLSMFRESGTLGPVLAIVLVELAVCAVALGAVNPVVGAAVLATGIACLVLLYPFSKTQFGGMSGDLAGFFLQVAELCMLAVLVVSIKVVGL